MANLKEVRIRIDSIQSTQQITSAMKMVAASKLRKAQTAIQTLRPYVSKLQEILQNLSASIEDTDENVFSSERNLERVLIVVVTSNRGLCGPFNSNVIKATTALIREKYAGLEKQGGVELYCIGKKGADYFTKNKYKVAKVTNGIFDDLTFENVVAMASALMQQYAGKKYDRIEIIYNQFKNAAVQILITEQFLPILPPREVETGDTPALAVDYIFEPSKEEIVRELMPKTLKIQLFKAILDSYASEHGARMTAMHQATDNARELLKDLRLSYNKARQAAITNELLEIVGGAEALKG